MPQPLTVVIFGASGDLTARKLVPALFNLAQKGRLPAEAQVVGVARSDYTDDSFRDHMGEKVREALAAAGEGFDPAEWAAFAARLHYVRTDVTQPGGTGPLADWFTANEGPDGRRLYYLSVSPELYPQLATILGEDGFAAETGGFRRLIIEKPFGHDLATA
ncbi:MAG: glucose-6-phosphate dehydrogenase, partial [Gemmataceae bacterium]|nr:glucose-6-phosphate dehydrogenase [Gemmataceae bacterium]